MRFLADMGISPATVEVLVAAGHVAVHLHEQQLDRLPDSQILNKARAEGAVVLTSDLDLGDLLAVGGETLPSVVVFRLADMRPANVNRHLLRVIEFAHEMLRKGAIVSVSESGFRVRPLPI
ncbi:MAG: DUF5615 family PIN-like protein [Acidobacteriota bacterium]